ncbi:MAG: menaquinone biosynthesis protein [Phycisphaeraceae bacterium]
MSLPTTKPNHDGACVVGCVSFLNARPLIDGLDDHHELTVRYDVPSALLEDLTAGEVDLALCPVIDYQLSDKPLTIVPVGGIGCDGPTLTVRLFSRVPLERVTHVLADTHSHTSVVLLRLLMQELYGNAITVESLDHDTSIDWATGPEAVLLIGDKVVTASPPDELYAHQLDLGSAWKTLTGLPFVFAVWMMRADETLGSAPAVLDNQRSANADRIEDIAAACAERHGWTVQLATHYMRDLLRYTVGPRELQAMQEFWARAAKWNLIERHRPLLIYPDLQTADAD